MMIFLTRSTHYLCLSGEHYSKECAAAMTTNEAPICRQSSAEEEAGGDALSTSSLRRKLFFHGDKGTPLSPVRSVSGKAGTV